MPIDGLRHVFVAMPPSFIVEWMSPVLPFKACPEIVETEQPQVRDDRYCEFDDAFLAQCENKMMTINQILPCIWAQNDRNA